MCAGSWNSIFKCVLEVGTQYLNPIPVCESKTEAVRLVVVCAVLKQGDGFISYKIGRITNTTFLSVEGFSNSIVTLCVWPISTGNLAALGGSMRNSSSQIRRNVFLSSVSHCKSIIPS
jgi:hypothetical protein